jgi:hypothetical protein
MALVLAAVAVTGTVLGTQFVSAWHHGHYGRNDGLRLTYRQHGGHVLVMAGGTGALQYSRVSIKDV